jgi:hypothetical protein
MQTLSSRKLVGIIAVIIGVVGLVLGLAVIHPAALTEAKDVVLLAIAGVVGLGGYQVWRQSINDKFPTYKIGPDDSIERLR